MEFESLKKLMRLSCNHPRFMGDYIVVDTCNRNGCAQSFYVRRIDRNTPFTEDDQFDDKLDPIKQKETQHLYHGFGCTILPYFSPC